MTATLSSEPFVSADEAAKLLRKHRRWLYANQEHLQIPRYKLGNQYRYRLSEVARWVENRAV